MLYAPISPQHVTSNQRNLTHAKYWGSPKYQYTFSVMRRSMAVQKSESSLCSYWILKREKESCVLAGCGEPSRRERAISQQLNRTRMKTMKTKEVTAKIENFKDSLPLSKYAWVENTSAATQHKNIIPAPRAIRGGVGSWDDRGKAKNKL